jgi:hypothetical protein
MRRVAAVGLADMATQFTSEQGDNARDILQRVIDNLLFYSDEVEMQRLPVRDPASALRLAARLFALERDLL